MKALWLTDIHLEFLSKSGFSHFIRDLCDKNADAILISGDIGQASTVGDYLSRTIQTLAIPVYFVLGNHDYYHGSILGVRAREHKKPGDTEFPKLMNLVLDANEGRLQEARWMLTADNAPHFFMLSPLWGRLGIDVVGEFRRKLKLTVFGGSGICLVALFRLLS